MRMNALARWIAAGAAFTSALLTSGCGSALLGPSVARPPVEPPPAAPLPQPQETPRPAEATAAPIVNAFGEINGVARSPAMAGAEASIRQHTACDEGYDGDVTVDPTGKLVAFTSTRHSERPDIYVQRVDGNAVIQLTADAADDAQPAFSPDGKRIAFSSTRAGSWDIYVMDSDGRNVEQITSTAAHEMHPTFSPDASRLAYCALSPLSDQWELWVVNLATRQRTMIGYGLFPSWSPRKDVDRIAFQRARQRGSRWFSLWTVDLVDGEPRRLTEVAASSNAAAITPTWSPDGSRLAFATVMEPAGKGPRRQDVWVVSADGAGRQRLTQGPAANFSPHWSVDNRIYFISNRGGHENIWSVRADVGSETFAGAAAATEARKTGTAEARIAPPTPAATAPRTPPAVGSADTGEAAH